jgi:outer membrane receptor for ferrienterochelin and colicins
MRKFNRTHDSCSRRVIAIAAAIFLLIATPYSSFATTSDPDDISIEELLNSKVYSASKYAQDASEAPSSITIVTADDIRKNGYRRLIDILGSLTGFYVRNRGTYSALGVRGFAAQDDSSSRILVLVNGHVLNSNIDDSAPIQNEFPVDIDLIDRVEVVRGPNSTLYGADAFFAVVNVITKTGTSAKGALASTEGGSYGTYKETATYGTERAGAQALLSESYSLTNAPGQLDTMVDPVGLRSDRDQSRRMFGLVSSHGFTLQGAVSSLQQTVPESSEWCGSCHQTDSHGTDFRGYADAQYQHGLWKNGDVTMRVYYDALATHNLSNDLRGCSEASCHGNVMDHATANGERIGTELKLTHRFFDRLRVTAGSEYRDNLRQDEQNYMNGYVSKHGATASTTQTFVDYSRTSTLWGIYGEGEYQLHKKLILNVGVRNDRYNYIGGSTNPRTSLIYTPLRSTTIKLLYGTAFRAPSFDELYYAGMFSNSAPNLKPETIRTEEVVLEQKLGKRMTLNASGFYNRIGNYIDEQTVIVKGQDQTEFMNSQAKAKGIEVELNGRLPSGVEARLSYTYQDAWNPVTGAWLLDSPRNLAKVNLSSPLIRQFVSGGIEAQFMSRCVVWPNYYLGDPPSYSGTPVSLNATLYSKELWRGFSLSATAYNLVGRPLGDPSGSYNEQNHVLSGVPSLLPDDRRTFRVKLTWTSGGESAKSQHNPIAPSNAQPQGNQ